MAKFESPLGNKTINTPQLRQFDVPDGSQEMPPSGHLEARRQPSAPNFDSGDLESFQARIEASEAAEAERQIKAARQAKISGKERLSEGAKRRIEILIGMTRLTRTVEIENNIFILQTLKSKEMREAIMAAAEFDGTVQSPYEIRRQLLARSLVSVADVDIAQFIGSDSLEARLVFVDELDDSLLNRLYDEYLLLKKESREKFTIKAPEEAKEVMDDLKKS